MILIRFLRICVVFASVSCVAAQTITPPHTRAPSPEPTKEGFPSPPYLEDHFGTPIPITPEPTSTPAITVTPDRSGTPFQVTVEEQ